MFPQTSEFTDFFAKQGIDVNNPVFMKWMDKSNHIGKFSSEYSKLWEKFIKDRGTEIFDVDFLIKKAQEFEKQASEEHFKAALKKAAQSEINK